jgi:AAA+ superfamily predicted ATPase
MNDRRRGRGEPTVLAIVGPFTSEPFALGLRALLKDSGDFDVITVDDPIVLGPDVAVGNPAILIVEGADPAACQDYLNTHFLRSVVLFDPIGARAFIGLENPDWKGIGDILRVAARDTGAPAERIRVVDPRTLPAFDAQIADAAVLFPLTEWLELSLGRALLRRAGHDTPGVPGWSIAASDALKMLALDPQATTEAQLVERLTAADIGLAVTRTSLPGPVARVAEAFALSALELRLLCLVLAPELDGRYATVIGVLQDDLTRRRPGLTLLAELMAEDEVTTWDLRRTVHASSSIIAQGLVQPAESDGLPVDVGLAPSRAVVAYLLASSLENAIVVSDAVLHRPSPEAATPLAAEEAQLAQQLETCLAERVAMVRLVGGGPTKDWFCRLTAAIGLPLVVGDLRKVERRVAAVGDWGVFARLAGGALMVLGTEVLEPVDRNRVGARLAEIARGARMVAADAEPSLECAWWDLATPMRAPTISTAQRAAWWGRAVAESGLALDADDIQRLAATTQIDPEHIQRSVVAAVRLGPGDSPVAAVQRAARELSSTPRPQGVRQIMPTYTWDDIVLSDARKELLQTIPLHVLQAGRVLEEWGFASRIPYGQGVAALFSGPSGTGKTMAALIIAGALGVDVLQVDLSKTISKYIGETEKNLDRIFDAAEGAGSVLLFDEADAIFGKRTEIKDAHDRHANVEVAYLLQRMEAFRGLAVLTTNFKQNIDDAFVRRLRFVIEFALPTAPERERIWHKAFPALAPLAGDVDVALLAGRLQIPGGSIQNIALHAAFLAAAAGGPITAADVLAATRRELVKVGMLAAERSLDELAVPA